MSEQTIFPLISGHLSLDLVNTEVVRRGVRHDLLSTPGQLINWLQTMQQNGILFPQQLETNFEQWAEDALPCVQQIRTFLRNGFETVANDQPIPNNWSSHLEDLIAKAPFRYKVGKDNLIPIPLGTPLYGLVSILALDAISLLATGELSSMRRCDNPECVLLFMDVSGRRKWCSMKICGNRTKVARHQARKDRVK